MPAIHGRHRCAALSARLRSAPQVAARAHPPGALTEGYGCVRVGERWSVGV